MDLVRGVMPVPSPDDERRMCAEHLRRLAAVGLTVAKFFIDGVIDSGTGWLVEPDTIGDGRESFWPDVDRYHRAVSFFSSHGFQCVTHATGDRGVREALDTYAQAGAAPGIRADVTVMAEDPADADPDDLVTVPVIMTIVDGEIVFGGDRGRG